MPTLDQIFKRLGALQKDMEKLGFPIKIKLSIQLIPAMPEALMEIRKKLVSSLEAQGIDEDVAGALVDSAFATWMRDRAAQK